MKETNLKDMYEKTCKEVTKYEELDGYHCPITEEQYLEWQHKEELIKDLEKTLGLPAREPRTLFYR